MICDSAVCVRTMTGADVEQAVEWAAQEGWNPGLHDGPIFHQTDPEGFFGAYLEDEMIGSVSAVAYDSSFGFVGFFIVKPEYRGRRVGIELGRRAMEYLGDRTIGVDGVEKKIHNYETYGFKLAYNNVRYEGFAEGLASMGGGLVPLCEVGFEELLAYDERCFGAARAQFLSPWLGQPDTHGHALIRNDKLVGYGFIRPCIRGWKIGPLFADDPLAAEQILFALVSALPTAAPFYLDVPAVNAAAVGLAEAYGMTPVFRTARMYKGRDPALPVEHIFGVTSFELG